MTIRRSSSPNIAARSQLDGHRLTVEIYRTDRDPGWILEVLNEFGTSTVHDEPFIADGIAWQAFEASVAEEGLMAFMSDSDRKKLSH
jgi:hypothetical protein